MKLNAAGAKKILDADLANIIRKVKAGKPLTQREREIVSTAEITAAPSAPARRASGMDHAVAILQTEGFPHVTKQLLRKLKKLPAFKNAYDGANRIVLDEMKSALTAHFAAGAPAETGYDKLALECRRLEAQARKVEAEANAVEEISVTKAAVITSNRTVSSELKKLLRKLETEMPGEVTGKTLAQNRAYGTALYDELCSKIQAWSDEWPE